jgi:hypothetical protein
MSARCPFCEAVHPIPAVPEPVGQQLASVLVQATEVIE